MATAYEAIYIVDATLAEDQVKAILDKYNGVITKSNGSVEDVDIWDPRRLAYEIKGHREGRYIVVNFLSDAAAKSELDRIFRISDDVIRHMIVKQDPKADRFPSKTRAAEQERREREAAARAAAAPLAPQPITDLGTSTSEDEALEIPDAEGDEE
ncbi:MAG: 30S ribosomal protein S6 [Armatimonadetes bacterium]|jgi:small subunit ribosomal protein S6|nr:30S ribosomal protein S6 [Armatimonadota bacterium]